MMGFAKIIGKTCGIVGLVTQYACVTHCAFEYVGDFVMVNNSSWNILIDITLNKS